MMCCDSLFLFVGVFLLGVLGFVVSFWFLMLCVVWVDVLLVVIFVQELCTFFHGVGCFGCWFFSLIF